MKKLTILTLFFFGFASLFAGFVSLPKLAFAETESQVEISSFSDLNAYVNSYKFGREETSIDGDHEKVFNANADDNIVLTSNIEFGESDFLSAAIGTMDKPFTGTFDGKGYSIRNFKVKIEDSGLAESLNKLNVGLFGVIKGNWDNQVQIKNIAFSGNTSIEISNASMANVGVLVGQAEYTNFSNIQISNRSINFTYKNNYSINYGTLIGLAERCNFENIVSRCANTQSWAFSNDNDYTFGGVIGKGNIINVKHGVIMQNLSADSIEFNGKAIYGGVVGGLSSGSIVNVAIENSYTFANSVTVGEIVGQLSKPGPKEGGISFVHWKTNYLNSFEVKELGENLANYQIINAYCLHPAISGYSLSQITEENNYFTINAHEWSKEISYGWDFDTIWYISDGNIYLQNFYSNYTANFVIDKYTYANSFYALDIRDSGKSVYQSSINKKYGEKFDLQLNFVEDRFDESASVKKYFSKVIIEHNNENVATITYLDDGVNVNVSNKSLFAVGCDARTVETQNDIVFTIKGLNNATSGDYVIKAEAKPFYITARSRLVTVANDGTPTDQKIQPGYVRYNPTDRPNFTITTYYLQQWTFNTSLREENSIYALTGWWVEQDNNESYFKEENTAENTRVLSFTFGDKIKNDCQVYADYVEDACEILFTLDGGISRIVCGGQLVDKTINVEGQGLKMPVIKTLRLDIYIKGGYNFNIEEFIDSMDIYKGGTGGGTLQSDFCQLVDQEFIEEENLNRYQFSLDMTKTKGGQYEKRFTIQPLTTKIKTKNYTWLWITLGVVGGVLLLAGIVVLIVFLVKRRGYGGGGMGGSPKIKKSSYKSGFYY